MSDKPKRIERAARLHWVNITDMKVSPLAQREMKQARVDKIAANFDAEMIGVPILSLRDEAYYIVDGQHRVNALINIGWGDQELQCWVYQGLSEADEAEMFLVLNDILMVEAMSRYKVGITAGREIECDIDRVVRGHGMVVSRDDVPGAIMAVGTLRKLYTMSDAKTLARTLNIIGKAYGDAGLEAAVIEGIGLLCHRYNGQLDDQRAIEKLGEMRGGVNGLTNSANKIRLATGNAKAHCLAAAAVEVINRGRGPKLPSWWSVDEEVPA